MGTHKQIKAIQTQNTNNGHNAILLAVFVGRSCLTFAVVVGVVVVVMATFVCFSAGSAAAAFCCFVTIGFMSRVFSARVLQQKNDKGCRFV